MPKPSPRSPLAEVQALMARAVMRPLTRDDGMRAQWSDGRATAQVAEGFIKPNDRLDSFERLEIYNQQYWWRLRGSFAEDFPGLRAVLGERRFEALTEAYLDACGSRSWSLGKLGSELEAFLLAHPETTAPFSALALDVARVEWAQIVAFDGEEEPRLPVAEIEMTSPSQLRLGLQPYLTLLELEYPADELLQRLKRRAQRDSNRASNAVSAIRPAPRRRLSVAAAKSPVYLAIHRVDFSVYLKRLNPVAYQLLSLLRDGSSLEEACAEAFASSSEPAEVHASRLREWFADWMSFGWFVRFEELTERAAGR